MNTSDTAKILKLIELLYPQFNKSYITDEDTKEFLGIWTISFQEESFEAVNKALMTHIRKSKYPPTILDLRLEILQSNNPAPEQAWAKVKAAIGAYYNDAEALSTLSGIVLKVATSLKLSNLRHMQEVEARSIFIETYKAELVS